MTNSNGGIVYGDVMVCLLFAVLARQGLLALSRAGRGQISPTTSIFSVYRNEAFGTSNPFRACVFVRITIRQLI